MGKKGEVFRPCVHCGETVHFVPWGDRKNAWGQQKYHWEHPNGWHHVCRKTKGRTTISAEPAIDPAFDLTRFVPTA
jgi:hypothetical protein